MKLAKTLIRHLPRPVATSLRRGKRRLRRARYRLRQRLRPVVIDQAAVVVALRECGLGRGDTVFFQSAMSSFGEIVGGASSVIAALEEVVGEEGLIAMPAFPIEGTAVEYLSAQTSLDLRCAPSTMGSISERFRKLAGTERSLHPSHSVSARGVGARELVAGHEDASTPFGSGTPFASLVDRNAWQVWFGCGVAAFTMYHAFECLRGEFPIPVFAEEPFSVRCVDANGHLRMVNTLVHEPSIAARRIDSNPRIAERWRSLLLERGVARSVTLGRGEILSVRLPRLMEELERLLQEGVTIYDIRIPATAASRQ